MSERPSVTIVNAPGWRSKVPQLAVLLKNARGSAVIADPSAVPSDPDSLATVVDPAYWSEHLAELGDALASVDVTTSGASGHAVSGAVNASAERLTLTVEEAASLLGISRAFAYESVHRRDIPSIRLGRRILVPREALIRLVGGSH
jgi:excisionase family DNA binding protein